MGYILSRILFFQIILTFGIFDNIPACRLGIIFGGFPRVCAGFIEKFWILWGILSSPSPYPLHSLASCFCVGRVFVWSIYESDARLPGTMRVLVLVLYFIVFLQWLTRSLVYLPRNPTHTHARYLLDKKIFFSDIGVGWVGKWWPPIVLQLPVLQILRKSKTYSDNLKAHI